MEMFVEHSCLKCGYPLYDEVYDYSIRNHGFPLCRVCQCWLTSKTKATEYAKRLYLELKRRHVPVEIEKFDGHKTIDIAIPRFKINIEVDGSHHNKDSKQALADLQRTKYSLERGYETIRIPNSLIEDFLDRTADSLVVILKNRKQEIDDERSKSINAMELSPRELQLYDLLVDFLKWLYIVFEVDGEYTKAILEDVGTEGILSDTYGNWANHEYMLAAFNKLTDYMQDNHIFESATPGFASDYEDFSGCSFSEFLKRNRHFR